MSQATWTEGIRTFTAGEALEAYRRVKIKSGTTTTPPEVEYADAGEFCIGVTMAPADSGDAVAIKTLNQNGTFLVQASKTISLGATVYGSNDGKVSDASSGTSQFVALKAATAASDIIECCVNPYAGSTASTISIADSGGIITGTTVEAALAEIMTGVKTAQYTIPPAIMLLATGAPMAIFADGASAVPGSAIVASKELAVRWNNHATPNAIMASFVMPQDFDDGAAVIAHFVGAIVKAGADEADSPTLTVEAYFGTVGADPGADSDCGGTSGEFLTAADAAWQEKTLTIASGDTPAAPCLLTLLIKPTAGELGTDDFVLLPPWLEVTRKCLTA